MAEPATPRFTVHEGEIVDTKMGQIIPVDRFNKLSTPEEKSSIESQLSQSGQMVDAPEVVSEDHTPEPAVAEAPPVATDRPSLDQFIADIKPLNPGYSDEQLSAAYQTRFAERPKDLTTWEDFRNEVKPLNPDYSDDQIKEAWQQQFGQFGAPEKNKTFGENLSETGRQLAAGFAVDVPEMVGKSLSTIGSESGSGPLADFTQQIGDTILADAAERSPSWAPDLSGRSGVAEAFIKGARAIGPSTSTLAAYLNPYGAVLGPLATTALFGGSQYYDTHKAMVDAKATEMDARVAGLETAAVQSLGEIASNILMLPVLRTAGPAAVTSIKGFLGQATDSSIIKPWVKAVGVAMVGEPATEIAQDVGTAAIERAQGLTTESYGDIAYESGTATLAMTALLSPFGLHAHYKSSKRAEAINTILNDPASATQEERLATVGMLTDEASSMGIPTARAWGEQATQDIIANRPIQRIAPGEEQTGAPRPTLPRDPLESVKSILDQPSVDEAITTANEAVNETPVVTPTAIDTFIRGEQYNESQKNVDQLALNKVFGSLEGAETSETGDVTLSGTPVRVVSPADLPAASDGTATHVLTSDAYEGLSVALAAEGKRLVVFDNRRSLGLDGVAWGVTYPDVVFIGSHTSVNPASVAYHEAAHLMEGSPLYTAFQQIVLDTLSPRAKRLALERHDPIDPMTGRRMFGLSDRRLLNEVSADIRGDAMSDPTFMAKVYEKMREQVGDEHAHAQAVGFLDTLKSLINRVTNALLDATFRTRDGRRLATQYVTNLEKVHDALATAVADLYVKQGVSTGAIASKDAQKLATQPRRLTQRVVVHPQAAKAFTELGRLQRGYPEDAMLRVHEAAGGGVLAPVVEHTGDLIHRMTHKAEQGTALRPYVQEKVDRVLKYLTSAYGFEKEMAENFAHNAKASGVALAIYKKTVARALQDYTNAHAKLPVYNLPQWLARRAAIEVGRGRFKDAILHLKELKTLADSNDFDRLALTTQFNEADEVKGYTRPVKGTLVHAGEMITEADLKTPRYQLEHGEIITKEEAARKGYRIVPHDLVSAEGAQKSPRQREQEKVANGKRSAERASARDEKAAKKLLSVTAKLEANANAIVPKAVPTSGAIINVGLKIGEKEGLTLPMIREALAKTKAHVLSASIHVSRTERTAVIQLDRPLTKVEMNELSLRLKQEAVPQRLENGTGTLYGPMAAKWGPYDPAQFLMPNGRTADQPALPSKPVLLEHYSRQSGLTEIQPEKHGTGQIGEERRRQENAEPGQYVPRSYFYRAGTKPEPRFVGLNKYKVAVPEDTLVDLSTMPGKDATEKEFNAKQAGFLGYYNPHGPMPNVVALFETTQVDRPVRAIESRPQLSPAPLDRPRSRADEFFKQALLRLAQDEIGQSILDEMEIANESPKTVVREFWDRTYAQLPEIVQRRFQKYITRLTGFSLGSVVAVDRDGTKVTGSTWEELYPATEAPTEVTALEGTERGLIALMKMANARLHSTTGRGSALDLPQLSPSPIFYSQVERVLEKKLPTKVSREQLTNILASPEMKADEVKWLGLEEFASTKEVFTKPEVLDFVRENRIEIREVTKKDGDWAVYDGDENFYFPNRKEANAYATKHGINITSDTVFRASNRESGFGTKFNTPNLTISGGTNYKEVLLTLPEKPNPEPLQASFRDLEELNPELARDFAEDMFLHHNRRPSRTDLDTELNNLLLTDDPKSHYAWAFAPRIRALFEKHVLSKSEWRKNLQTKFYSGHWNEPNVLAHVRFNDRTGPNGEKILFLEEVQSDWHQRGKKEGYTKDTKGWTAESIVPPDMGFTHWQIRDADGNPVTKIVGGTQESAIRKAAEGIPDAPFKKTWHELALKRMLRYAAEHGYDQLAWTTGEQQAERYDLSKQISKIEWIKASQKYVVGEQHYRITAYDLNNHEVLNQSPVASELPDIIGKDAADKILTSQESKGVLAGLDLKVGGEGMKGFYDQILPTFMNKYAKKWGAKVGETSLLVGGKDVDLTGMRTGAKREIVHSLPITESMKQSVLEEGQPQFSVADRIPWDATEPGKLDHVIRTLQDKNIDIKRVVEAIKATGAKIADALNPVYAEEMYQKRAEQRSTDYTNTELRPFAEVMRGNKITVEQVDRYAHARHVIADDLNTRLQAINPDLIGTPEYERLAGMTDAEAREILATTPKREIMEKLMTRLDAMVNKTRELLVEYGLESDATIQSWREQYQAYVPLRREGFDDDGHPTGTGRSVRGSTAKPRVGSQLAVENVLANIAQARDQAITRGEKMRPVIALAGLLMLHPNKAFATLDKYAPITYTDPLTNQLVTVAGDLKDYKRPMIRRINPQTGLVQFFPDPTYKGRENVVNFRIKGIDYAIVFNERNTRAMEVAIVLKDLDTPKLTGLMAAVAPFTRYLAAINTQYNPIFGIVNFVRDAQFATIALSSTPLAGKQGEILKNSLLSLKGIYQDARDVRYGTKPSSATAQLWERFQHVGGPTGYRDLFFTASARAADINRMLDPNAWASLNSFDALGKRIQETWLFKHLSDYNLTMENAIRLGVFKSAVDMGLSDIAAASLAKNITVNFNKKGQIGAQMGSLYAFFNANVQGTARILETLFERTADGGFRIAPMGKKIIAGGLLIGVLQSFALAIAGFGADEPPEYIKDKNLILPVPGTPKGYVMSPMPLGFNLLPTVGRIGAETVRAMVEGRPAHVIEKGFNLFSAMFNALSPTGGSGGVVTELSPTVVDPVVALATNRDWTGKSISKEDRSSLSPTPGHTRAKDTATAWAMALSKGINWATGGTDYTPGVLSPTPDAIDYLIQQATGGVGREVSKTAQVVRSSFTGEELPAYKVPLVGRFIGSASGSASVRETFYDNVKAVNLAMEEVKGRALHHEDFTAYVKAHPEARFETAAVSVERAIAQLQKQKRTMIQAGSPRTSVTAKEQQITEMMTRFNASVNEARRLR